MQSTEEEYLNENIYFRIKHIFSLEEIKRLIVTYKKQKELLQGQQDKDQEFNELRKIVVILKSQEEEAKIMNEVVTNQLNEREGHCEKLEVEIVSLINDL